MLEQEGVRVQEEVVGEHQSESQIQELGRPPLLQRGVAERVFDQRQAGDSQADMADDGQIGRRVGITQAFLARDEAFADETGDVLLESL